MLASPHKSQRAFATLTTAATAAKIGIIMLFSSANAGDNANAEGIINSILNLGNKTNKSVEFTILNPIQIINPTTKSAKLEATELEKLQAQLQSSEYEQYLVIAPGSHGLKALERIEKTPNSIFISSAHQPYPELLEKTQEKLDIVVLPKGTIDLSNSFFSQLDRKLVKTKGVPHNTTEESLRKDYSIIEAQMKKFLKGKTAILVIMGGDAPDQKGIPWLYTPEEAIKFARYLADQVKSQGVKLIITNGPRTGQKNLDTKENIPNIHRIGAEIDAVTKAFSGELLEVGLVEGEDFLLQDFRFGSSDNLKSDALFGMSLVEGYKIYVPGESTTLVSIACNTLPKENIVLYEIASMNPSHHANLMHFYRDGHANKLTMEFEFLPPREQEKIHKYENAADKAAIKILQSLEQKIHIAIKH